MFVTQPAEFSILTPDNGTSIELVEATPQTNPAVTFTWEDVDYGTPTEVTYEVQFAKNGTDFAEPSVMQSSTARSYTITVGALNTIARNYFDDGDPATEDTGTIDVRIKSTVGTTGAEPKYSNVVSIVVTPFIPVPTVAPKMYVVGGFQSAGNYGNDWTPATGAPLEAASPTSQNFEGYVYFANGSANYKFLPTNTGWDGDYGDTGPSNGSYSGTLEQTDEVDCGLPGATAGFYRVKVNLGATPSPTYELTAENWAITGSATPLGWPSADNVTIPDTDMTYDPALKVWTIDINLTAGGAIKFRANDAWTVNLGGADGVMTYGGADIPITTSGNYTVHLDLSVPRQYTYTLELN
ncbi:SusE domain-containing protein [Flavobacterium sp. MAH-1]|uniref:SusE domain-containing protein n=1 Tax=Flavobacterium agri TaxID=2743471 RepID=A0A7Y9C590_9FLAO|nr:SusE domain-containing protein [Flavobacterium agri]NUY80701.1 SusE domain-containing protein [Flavobacterium agri]NYA70725.1 SusE domain-containing protein [Flavobacterium agri]